MPHATLADAPAFGRDGFTFRPLAVPSRGSVELAVWSVEVAPGAVGEPHSVDREEVFVLLTGSVSATVGGRSCTLVPGDALIVPPDTEFSLRGAGEGPAAMTVCSSAGVRARLGDHVLSPPWAR